MLDKFDNKKSPFKVPENYFENFNAQIMEQLPTKVVPTKVSIRRRLLPWVAAAAVVCGVIFTIGLGDNKTQQNIGQSEEDQIKSSVSDASLASISEDDFYQFLEDKVTDAQLKEMMSYEY